MDMGSIPQDIHDAGLSLGLAIGPAGGTASGADAGLQHRRRGEDSPSPRRPPLTFSLSGEGGGGLPAQTTEASLSTSAVKREKEAEEGERVSSRGSDEEEDSGGSRKKLRLTKEQSAFLEDRFKEHSTLNPRQKQALAKQLNLRPRQVEVWFQNRRARTKLKQTEVDCELLKRCYQTLTTENQRLQKELLELKALRLVPPPSSPQPPPSPVLYMQFPAATLAMCPSCERMGGGRAPTDGRPQLDGAAAVGAVAAPQKTGYFFKRPFTHSAAC